jgi:ribosomal protein RSM22 (predicted rRNA methylase)
MRVVRPLYRFRTTITPLQCHRLFGAYSATTAPDTHPHAITPEIVLEPAHSEEGDVTAAPVHDDESVVRAARDIYGETLIPGILNKKQFELYRQLYGMPTWVASQSTIQAESEATEEEQEHLEETASEDAEDAYVRHHPLTILARSRTTPATVSLPPSFTGPVLALLASTAKKHLLTTSLRVFGGPGFPNSPITPSRMINAAQKPIGLSPSLPRMSGIEADAYMAVVMPSVMASLVGVLEEVRRRMPKDWINGLDRGGRVLDAGAGGAGILAWSEVLRNASLEDQIDEDGNTKVSYTPPPKIRGSVVIGSDTLRDRVNAVLDNTTFLPRIPDFYAEGATSEAKQPARYQYDLIIAPHTLLPWLEDWQRKRYVEHMYSLLSPQGGVLVLLEKAHPAGFNAIAGAREWLLRNHGAIKDVKEDEEGGKDSGSKAVVLAPCTNQSTCPLFTSPESSKELKRREKSERKRKQRAGTDLLSEDYEEIKMTEANAQKKKGKASFCHFSQRFLRPAFYQNLMIASSKPAAAGLLETALSATSRSASDETSSQFEEGDPGGKNSVLTSHRNHADVNYSYVVFKRVPAETQGSAPNSTKDISSATHSSDLPPLPRIILPPLKRTGHIMLDVCTPEAHLERWTVPKSFGRQAYRDARKSKWGDLWALDAKTKVLRGAEGEKVSGKTKEKGGKGDWELLRKQKRRESRGGAEEVD